MESRTALELLQLANDDIVIWNEDDKRIIHDLERRNIVRCGKWQKDDSGWWLCKVEVGPQGLEILEGKLDISATPKAIDPVKQNESLKIAILKIHETLCVWWATEDMETTRDMLLDLEHICEVEIAGMYEEGRLHGGSEA